MVKRKIQPVGFRNSGAVDAVNGKGQVAPKAVLALITVLAVSLLLLGSPVHSADAHFRHRLETIAPNLPTHASYREHANIEVAGPSYAEAYGGELQAGSETAGDAPVLGLKLSVQAQGEASPPNPLIYLDIWLFGGLILVVMIFVTFKYLLRLFRPDNRDPEEGLQPWEDPDYDHDETRN